MTNEILILTGACGVGKSTISKAWAKERKGAVVESDYFGEWLFSDKYDKFSLEEEFLMADLSFVTAKVYLNHEIPVAIEGVWSTKGLDTLKDQIEREIQNAAIKFVWLRCEINENHRRDELRVPEDQMKHRVDIVNDELKAYEWGDYVHVIDSTHFTVEETLSEIDKIAYL